MKGFLKIVTKDPYLGQKLRFELGGHFNRMEISENADGHADVFIYDCRMGAPLPQGENIYYVAEDISDLPEGRCLPLPLPLGCAERLLEGRKAPLPLLLSETERAVHFYAEEIRLTDVEYSLLSALAKAQGEFVSRTDLRAAVWGDEGTDGLLSVYIHYLREKLECGGEKVILSSRKYGYALAEKFAKGEGEC